MADPLKARLPCLEHGVMYEHGVRDENTLMWKAENCPGGREVLLVPTVPDYEMVAKELREWFLDGDSLVELEAKRIVDLAAVGDTWTIEKRDE